VPVLGTRKKADVVPQPRNMILSWFPIIKPEKADREDIKKKSIMKTKSNGHKFYQNLVCVCGVKWKEHQMKKIDCSQPNKKG